jgi:hypothetical protein
MSLETLLANAKTSTLASKIPQLESQLRLAEQEIAQFSQELVYNPDQASQSYSDTIIEYRAQRYAFHLLQFMLDIIPEEAQHEAAAIRSYLMSNSNAQYVVGSLLSTTPGNPVSPSGGACAHTNYQP